MQTVTVRTAELSGRALDWAVGQALGYQIEILPSEYGTGPRLFYNSERWAPSTEWSQGGPLIHSLRLNVDPGRPGTADWYAFDRGRCRASYGETPLIAICRTVVDGTFGDLIDIPAELTGGDS